MASAPAVVIVCRHGARLDAADKTWHLSSPAPYDPPLTYGGWTQARALGNRIASLLDAREALVNDAHVHAAESLLGIEQIDDNLGARPRRRRGRKIKHRLVIHSSPFVRCVQTSIGISAGMAQFQGDKAKDERRKSSGARRKDPNTAPKKSKEHVKFQLPGENGTSAETETASLKSPTFKPSPDLWKPKLRVDAFLGEWLSPDYYENITPPPTSAMMVADAKAGLLQRETLAEVIHNNNATGNFPGGWRRGAPSRSNTITGSAGDVPFKVPSFDNLAQALADVQLDEPRKSPTSPTSPESITTEFEHYVAPQPGYALSPSQPIPRGFVAHARDACVDIDLQWDSIRAPQDWGDGGEFPEEWSHMHKRFRKGLAHVVGWYAQNGISGWPAGVALTKTRSASSAPSSPVDERHGAVAGGSAVTAPAADAVAALQGPTSADAEVETVLILVTHGAGCNALIGAITGQPVLMDVGLASLTMAVGKTDALDELEQEFAGSTSDALSASPVVGGGVGGGAPRVDESTIPTCYDLKLTASVDHLRPGASSTTASAGGSRASLSNSAVNSAGSTPGAGNVSMASYFPTGGSRRRFDTLPSQFPPLHHGHSPLHPSNPSSTTHGLAHQLDRQLSIGSDGGDPSPTRNAALGSIRRPSYTPLHSPGVISPALPSSAGSMATVFSPTGLRSESPRPGLNVLHAPHTPREALSRTGTDGDGLPTQASLEKESAVQAKESAKQGLWNRPSTPGARGLWHGLNTPASDSPRGPSIEVSSPTDDTTTEGKRKVDSGSALAPNLTKGAQGQGQSAVESDSDDLEARDSFVGSPPKGAGLWGAAEGLNRAQGTKRRWTVGRQS